VYKSRSSGRRVAGGVEGVVDDLLGDEGRQPGDRDAPLAGQRVQVAEVGPVGRGQEGRR
jgi:hypothetical protein